jgi:fructoselysine-6-P-deglycase FrlB-like protein
MNPEGFLADVLDEPRTLAAVLDAHAAALPPRLEPGRRVLLIGMGSSRYAALVAATALRARGVDAVAEYASTGAPAPPAAGTVAIGISASGGTDETVAALARHAGISRTIAITNAPASPLADVADETVALHAGIELGGVSCKTFQASLAVLALMAGTPPAALRPAVDAQAALLDARGAWLEELLALLAGPRTIYAVAPAERISSALQSALMLREGPRVPAAAAETGDWLHVDVYLSKHPGYRALLFGGSRFDAGVMEWARERASSIVAVGRPVGGAVLHIPFPGAEDPLTAMLVETSVAELAAATMWNDKSV